MTNGVGVCTIAFKQKPIDDVLSLAAAAGADGVELWGQPPHVQYPIDRESCQRIRRKADAVGVEIAALGSYWRADVPQSYNGVEVTIENQLALAKHLGTRTIRVWAGDRNYEATDHDRRQSIVSSLQRLGEEADREGITIVLERHNNTLTNSWDSPEWVLSSVGRSNVLLNYQVPNPAPAEELLTRGVADYRRYLRVSGHAHLQNYLSGDVGNLESNRESNHGSNHGSNLVGDRCRLDSGVVDYSYLGEAVKETGYSGYFMIEFLPEDIGEESEIEALARDIEYVKRCIATPCP